MTALSILQNACGRLSLDIPSVVFSSTNDQVIQLRYLLNEELIDLARINDRGWQKLQTEKTFTTTAAAVQTSAVPSDFDFYINGTMFNRTISRRVIGPLTPQEWQEEKAGSVYTSVYNAFRFRGGDILITPTPTAGQTVAYEYVTNLRCTTSGGTGQTIYAADTDLSLLDEDQITQGVIWRFKQRKGFDYAEDFATYQTNLDKLIARDGGKKTLSLVGQSMRNALAVNVPEGSWS